MGAFRRTGEVLLEEAWNWLVDVGILNVDDEDLVHTGDITSGEVIANVDRLYDGGWYQFTEDHKCLEEWTTISVSTHHGIRRVTQKSNFGNTRTV